MMKTLVTIGPASLSSQTIQNFSIKTNLFRLNGSHSDLDWHRNAISMIRNICPNAFILMDIPGIKPRTANMETLQIQKGEVISFGELSQRETSRHVKLTKPLPGFGNDVQTFSLNDGQFIFDIVGNDRGTIIGKSRETFELLPKKGINIPGSTYDEQKQFEIYSEFIEKIKSFEIDALGISFIQTGTVIKKLRNLFPNLIQIAKVENSQGWRNVADIAAEADAIMIDRGDLAAEVHFNNLYPAVTEIAEVTKSFGKPLIMATENLESMVSRESPSKSEVMSLGHSADIGADCIMLSEETALSENAILIVDWLHDFCAHLRTEETKKISTIKPDAYSSIWRAVQSFTDLPFVLMSKSGYAVSKFYQQTPKNDCVLITENPKLKKLVQLYRSTITILDPVEENSSTPSDTVWNTINANKAVLFNGNNELAALCVSKYVRHSRANSLTIYHQDDFS